MIPGYIRYTFTGTVNLEPAGFYANLLQQWIWTSSPTVTDTTVLIQNKIKLPLWLKCFVFQITFTPHNTPLWNSAMKSPDTIIILHHASQLWWRFFVFFISMMYTFTQRSCLWEKCLASTYPQPDGPVAYNKIS